MPSVLITGGAGYIGSHMAWELLDAGENVVVVDRLSTGFDWAVPPEAKLIVGDIDDSDLIASTIRDHDVRDVIHFAGSIVVPESVVNPLLYYENNTSKTRTLLDTVVRSGVKNFVFSSTAAVYGGASTEPVSEDARCNPESPYGRSKLMTEWMLADVSHAHSLSYAILRYFNVAGADPKGRAGQSAISSTHLIKAAAEVALGRRQYLNVFGTDYPTPDGTCVRDYIHVSDLVAAHRLALDYLRAGNPYLLANCGYGYGHSVREVIQAMNRACGHEIDVRIAERRPGDPAAIVANSTLLRRELGWVPLYADIEKIASDALAWERHLQSKNSSRTLD